LAIIISIVGYNIKSVISHTYRILMSYLMLSQAQELESSYKQRASTKDGFTLTSWMTLIKLLIQTGQMWCNQVRCPL